MKKITFWVFFLSLANFSFAVELWNGFTTEMSKDQVLERVLELFQTNRPYYESDHESVLPGYHYSAGPSNESLYFSTDIPAYPVIVAHFRNNKLYTIVVWWGSDVDTLLTRHKSQFGQPSEMKSSKTNKYSALGSGSWHTLTMTDYKWQKQEIYIYLSTIIYPASYPDTKSKSSLSSFFIDRIVYDAWQAERDKEERQKKEAENARRKAANEGITF